VNAHDDEDDGGTESFPPLPSADHRPSPPPSFHSRSASPSSRRLLHDDPLRSEADQTLADTFGDGDDSDDDEEPDARQRLMRANPEPQAQPENGSADSSSAQSATQQDGERGPSIQRRVTLLPSFATPTTSGRVIGGIHQTNDGVFANLNAKPERGEKNEDLPPVCSLIFRLDLMIFKLTMR
jgi:hypothetical protein